MSSCSACGPALSSHAQLAPRANPSPHKGHAWNFPLEIAATPVSGPSRVTRLYPGHAHSGRFWGWSGSPEGSRTQASAVERGCGGERLSALARVRHLWPCDPREIREGSPCRALSPVTMGLAKPPVPPSPPRAWHTAHTPEATQSQGQASVTPPGPRVAWVYRRPQQNRDMQRRALLGHPPFSVAVLPGVGRDAEDSAALPPSVSSTPARVPGLAYRHAE